MRATEQSSNVTCRRLSALQAITALMLVVTILAENVAKTDSVPGVGESFIACLDIDIVCS